MAHSWISLFKSSLTMSALQSSVRWFTVNVLIVDRLGFESVIVFVLCPVCSLFPFSSFSAFLFWLSTFLWFISISFLGGLLTLCFVILMVVSDFWLISLIYHGLPSRILCYFTYIQKKILHQSPSICPLLAFLLLVLCILLLGMS